MLLEKFGSMPPSAAGDTLNGNGASPGWIAEDPLFSVKTLRNWLIALPGNRMGLSAHCIFESRSFDSMFQQVWPLTFAKHISTRSSQCYSFPDRSISETVVENGVGNDHSFHFRFRQSSPDVSLPPASFATDPDQWHGYCLFRQQKDVSVKRNYGQKSFVIISQHDFPTLYRDHMLARTLSLLDFAASSVMIESACAQIANWPPPRVGRQELPFFGSIFDVHIPPHEAFPLQGLSQSKEQSAIHPLEVFTSEPVGSWSRLLRLLPSVADLYIIYERVLLSEPVVVLSSDPRSCSEFVSLAIDMIRPTPYAGDYRPYVTMHSDFFAQANGGTPTKHFLIGITNPFILKRMHIPSNKKHNTPSSSSGGKPYVVVLSQTEPKPSKRIHHLTSGHNGNLDTDYPSGTIDNEAKGYIARDWSFIKSLETSLRSDNTDDDVSIRIRRHFAYLTALFLAPLDRYMATLITTPPGSKNAEFAHFSEIDFLSSLSKHGSSLQFKGKTGFQRNKVAESFYKRFCRCPSFYSLLQMKMELASNGGFADQPSSPPNSERPMSRASFEEKANTFGSAAPSINESSDFDSDH